VELHEEAAAEYDAAFDWYLARSPDAALKFDAEFDRALAEIAQAPQRWGVLSSGSVSAAANRFDEAIVVSKQISEIDPDDILAHASLSILYQKKGMVPEAEAEGNKARVLGWKQQLKKAVTRG
jgi:tetratricopeptide (TPR) repeat protein